MKLNLDKLRNTLRTTLIDIWEYVIPIWKISGLFKSIKSKKDLENAKIASKILFGKSTNTQKFKYLPKLKIHKNQREYGYYT